MSRFMKTFMVTLILKLNHSVKRCVSPVCEGSVIFPLCLFHWAELDNRPHDGPLKDSSNLIATTSVPFVTVGLLQDGITLHLFLAALQQNNNPEANATPEHRRFGLLHT
jgi:hypothetical protein